MKQRRDEGEYVVCVSNKGYRASLVVRRLYRVLHDEEASRRGLIRVIDESGEDYLYPADMFVAIELTKEAGRRLAAVS